MEFEASLERYKAIIDSALEEYLSGFRTDAPVLREAMLYAAMGGKRLRGAIVLAVCEELGGDIQDALGLAMAIEMVHAYSLVHDDLPCMDDDDTRRGKPSCHKKYGEAVALLCGDALLTAAFEVAATFGRASSATSGVANAGACEVVADCRGPGTGSVLGALSTAGRIRAIRVLASAAGADGMVAGQVLDLGLGGSLDTVEAVTQMYRLKTGRLFEAAAKMGAIAALVSHEATQVVVPMGGMAATGSDEPGPAATPTGATGATAPDEPFRSQAAGESINAVTQAGTIASGASKEVGKASTRLGTTTFEMSEEVVQAAGTWGLSFGYAFQIADDLDDMDDTEAEEGKTTLAQLTSAKDAREEAVQSLRASLAALSKFPGKRRFLETLSSRYLYSLSMRTL